MSSLTKKYKLVLSLFVANHIDNNNLKFFNDGDFHFSVDSSGRTIYFYCDVDLSTKEYAYIPLKKDGQPYGLSKLEEGNSYCYYKPLMMDDSGKANLVFINPLKLKDFIKNNKESYNMKNKGKVNYIEVSFNNMKRLCEKAHRL